jgi:hypothetical protein
MKHSSTALLIAALVAAGTLSARAEVYELSTTWGKSYHACRVLKIELDGVSFKHDKGTAKVLFKDLTPKWREHFGYDAEKAKAHEVKLKEDKVKAREAAAKRASEIVRSQQEAANLALENQTLAAMRAAAINGAYARYDYGGLITLSGAQFTSDNALGVNGRYSLYGNGNSFNRESLCNTLRTVGSADLRGPCVTEQQIVNGRRFYVTKRQDFGGYGFAGQRGFSTGCAANGYTPQPFFAVPGIGPHVAMPAAPRCAAPVIRGGGVAR